MFYIPEMDPQEQKVYEECKKMIEEHGGMVVDQHECFTYQIKPNDAKLLKVKDFYKGTVYLDCWIKEAINEAMNKENPNEIGGNKMIQKKDDHILLEANKDKCKNLNVSKKKKFTIIEGLKLFSLMSTNNTENLNKNSFWLNVEKNNAIPERTSEQMKKFYHKNEH